MKQIAAFLLIVAALNAQTLLTDDFTSASLNTTKWRTVTGIGAASVVQSSGGVTTTAGGVLATTAQFTPPYSISGTVSLLDIYEHFEICFRSISTGTVGMFVSFSNDGDQISIQQANSNGTVTILRVDSFPFANNKPYAFEIRDTGETITLFINGMEKISAQSTFSAGGYVAFRSRNFSQTASRLSAVTISALSPTPSPTTVYVPYPVPDTSSHLVNMSTLGSGTFTTGFVIAGETPKKMLIRGVGPTLRIFGVANSATDTRLTLTYGGQILATNIGWSNAPNAAQIAAFTGAFGLQTNSADSAILLTLNPGSYTATVASNGAVLLEAYEVP